MSRSPTELSGAENFGWRELLTPLQLGLHVFAGLLSALVTVTYSVSYAALIFPGELSKCLPYGIASALLSAAVIGFWTAGGSSFRFAIAGPDSNAAAILALMVAMCATTFRILAPKAPIWPTLLSIMVLCSLVTGGFLYVLGRFRLGRFIRFIPYPVVGGFLAGTGWLIMQGAFSVMTGMPANLSSLWSTLSHTSGLWVWCPGVFLALGLLFLVRRFRAFWIMPVFLIGSIVLYHVFLWTMGISVEDARKMGLLLKPFENGSLLGGWQAFSFSQVRVSMLFEQTTELMAMMSVVAITILLNATGVELATMKDADIDRELRTAGKANMFAGLFGGMVGYLSISRSLLNHKAGARHRLAGFVSAGVCAVLLFWGAGLLAFLPRPILGGILLYLGLSLLVEWIVDTWSKISHFEYGLVVLILLIIASWGFLPGIGVGLVVACLLFAFSYSRIHVIKYAFSGAERQSNVERSRSLQQRLNEYSDRIYILCLQGYIFFGTSTTVLDHVRERLRETSGVHPMRYLILDFRLVSDIDSSALLGFVKMRQLAQASGVTLIFSRISTEIEGLLRANACIGDDTVVRVVPDLDRGIEWCEDEILKDLRDPGAGTTVLDLLAGQFPNARIITQLLERMERIELAPEHYLFKQGDEPDGLYIVVSGKISVLLEFGNGKKKRLRTMGAGTIVGEMGLYLDSVRSASVIAERRCSLFRLSRESMAKMLEEEPELASEVHHAIVRLLALRLAHTNRELSALYH